jgi:hypothetical protein
MRNLPKKSLETAQVETSTFEFGNNHPDYHLSSRDAAGQARSAPVAVGMAKAAFIDLRPLFLAYSALAVDY